MVLSILGASMAFTGTTEPTRSALAQTPTQFCVIADARVQENNPDNNYGNGVILAVDTSSASTPNGTVQTYLKFDVTVPAGMEVSSATLTLWVRPTGTDGTAHSVNIYSVADTSWTEGALTWNNRPTLGTVVGTIGPLANPNGTAYAASALINPDAFSGTGLYSFGLAYPAGDTHSDGIDFSSKEDAPPGPCLDLTFAPTPNEPPTLTDIPNQTMTVGETRDLTITANDPENDPLTYGGSSSDDTIVTASVASNVVTLNAIAPGTATVSVTVNDGTNPEVSDTFDVLVLAPGEPTPVPTEEPTAEPTEEVVVYTAAQIAAAQAPLCADLSGQTNPIIRASVPADAVTNGNVYCRVLAEDGVFPNPIDSARIGDPGLITYGVIHAVDVFGVTADGLAYPAFNHTVTVCLQGAGRFIYLSALNSPRTTYEPPSFMQDGYTCATIPAAGTVVLIPPAPMN